MQAKQLKDGKAVKLYVRLQMGQQVLCGFASAIFILAPGNVFGLAPLCDGVQLGHCGGKAQ